MIYWLFVRNEKSLKNKFKKILDLIISTFKTSLTTNEILEYKWAICRDYAKLTASLLLNLYPKNKIYFLTFPRHVATGIEINGKIYILDQKMPILTPSAWLNKWNVNEANLLELKKENNKLHVEYVGKIRRDFSINFNQKWLKELLKEVINAINENRERVDYIIKKGLKFYDINDDIIKESLVRMIKYYLQKELVSKFCRIHDIKLNKKGEDIVINIKLKGD
ncbi:transglutaminase-like protease [Methanocaldococcus bathoardescens]|uniref:Transglutaminase-like protease n=2 Tax=Methanocaldococcus bathoardescens TaxID=1301915 RepID=A0A076LG71_9EURY|nr:transglutaminase-like protease [Methanocaldococcus bathoardescens]